MVTIDPEVAAISAELATQEGAQELAAALVFNLQVENEAISHGDAALLPAVSDGARLRDVRAEIEAAGADGERVISNHTFDSLDLTIVFPGGFQRGPNAGLRATGTVEEVTLSPTGEALQRVESPFATTFALRLTTEGTWLNTTILPYDLSDIED
jgi:hypothetical protein